MKKAVIVSVVLALFSLLAVCTVLIVELLGKPDKDEPSYIVMSPTSTGDYWGSRLSQLLEEEAQKSTRAQTTTEELTTTSTSKRSWFTAHSDRITAAPSREETTTKTTVVTTRAQKTTRTDTQKELEAIYQSVYNKTMAEYNRYKEERLEYIAEIDAEIATQEAKMQAFDAQYEKDIANLYEKYEYEKEHGRFFPIASWESSYRNAYLNNVAPIRSSIAELEAEKERVKADLVESESQLQEIIQAEYLAAVEDFQKKTLS